MFSGIALKLPPTLKFSTPKALFWVNSLLVILLSYTLAQLTWQLVGDPTVPAIAAPVPMDEPHPVDGAVPDMDSLASLHLFGNPDAKPKVAKAELEAPKTRLNLVLKGVFAGESQDEAVAIIASGAREEKSYRKGDTIAGAARVHRILADRVILERGGQYETLYLPRETLDGLTEGDGRNTSASTNRTPPQANVKRLDGIRKILENDPQAAMGLLRAEPVMAGEELKGYRVRPGRERALFARAGLRPGDIVTAVNGISLSDKGEMMRIFQQLKSTGKAELTLERGGRSLTLPIVLE